jgi:hypothetical protein
MVCGAETTPTVTLSIPNPSLVDTFPGPKLLNLKVAPVIADSPTYVTYAKLPLPSPALRLSETVTPLLKTNSNIAPWSLASDKKNPKAFEPKRPVMSHLITSESLESNQFPEKGNSRPD